MTGTTGSLGTALLAKLCATPEVKHIYALNRFSEDGVGLKERQAKKLQEWGFNADILDSGKVTLIEGHMATEKLGMSIEMYEKVTTPSAPGYSFQVIDYHFRP